MQGLQMLIGVLPYFWFFTDTGISHFNLAKEDAMAMRFITLMCLYIHPGMSFITGLRYAKAVIPAQA